MNQKADELGLTYTRFSNSHGLQNAMNISTTRDILHLCIYATKNESFRKIMN
jgi:D-alanyl-D-alanine carboxypeptidase